MSTLSPFIQLCIAATATRKINKSQSNLKEVKLLTTSLMVMYVEDPKKFPK